MAKSRLSESRQFMWENTRVGRNRGSRLPEPDQPIAKAMDDLATLISKGHKSAAIEAIPTLVNAVEERTHTGVASIRGWKTIKN